MDSFLSGCRRKKVDGVLGLTFMIAMLPPATCLAEGTSPVVAINAEAATAPVMVTPLRDGISVLMGSGGNITVLNGPREKLLVDGGISVSRPRIEGALRTISASPVRYVINTHYHWDHTDSNAWLHAQGATIVAQENTRTHLAATMTVHEWNYTFVPSPQAALPTLMVVDTRTLTVNGQHVRLDYYGPSHTDGDLSVYFEEANVLATGDTFWNGVYPFIDADAGGTIDGMIRAANANISRANDRTIVVAGHGPNGSKADLIEYRDMLVAVRNNVAKLKASGMTLQEVLAANPTAAYDAKWGQFVIGPAFFARLVYAGL